MHRDGFGFGLGFFEEMGLAWLTEPGQCTCTSSTAIVSSPVPMLSLPGLALRPLKDAFSKNSASKQPAFQAQLPVQAAKVVRDELFLEHAPCCDVSAKQGLYQLPALLPSDKHQSLRRKAVWVFQSTASSVHAKPVSLPGKGVVEANNE